MPDEHWVVGRRGGRLGGYTGRASHEADTVNGLDVPPAAAGDWSQCSLWLDGLGANITQRSSLQRDVACDVAIIGAGMTGLWCAYYLKLHDPGLEVVVIEREIAGFGPSGRNGGWVSSGMPGTPKAWGIAPDSPAARLAERETFTTVDEIGRVVEREAIDCGFSKAGMLTVASTAPQVKRLQAVAERGRRLGLGAEDIVTLNAAEVENLASIPGVIAGSWTPHGARMDPARLTRGLASACERLGVQIFEGTEATEFETGVVKCGERTVRAKEVVRATEAYTIEQPGQSRSFLPLYSLMIATEPLPQNTWDQIGWAREGLLIRDSRHLFFYAQRTPDGRIAMGGRGAPYEFGSPISHTSERNAEVRTRLETALRRHFPAVAGARITHHWGGPLAVPRDWAMTVTRDAKSGVTVAGGYSGHGVVASNIAGRTVSDLIGKTDSDLVRMPWVGHSPRKWEPEPMRFIASRAIIRVLERADRIEDTTGKTARSELLVRPFMPGH